MRSQLFYTLKLIILILLCNNLSAQPADDYTALIKQQETIEAQKQAAIPKENIAKHVQAITTSKAIITALANANRTAALTKLNPVTKPQVTALGSSAKNNLADIGMMLFLQGPKGKDAALYLVSSAIIRNPKDTLAVNDLGVLLKNDGQYDKAFQCFKYADQLNNKSSVFKTNLGWTAAYYGDFISAATYFNDAIALNQKNTGPLEGLCALAYAKGDYQSLMQHLFKRMQLSGGGSSGMPSGQLLDWADDAFSKDAGLRKQNPFDDHTFDNPSTVEDDETPGRSAANGTDEYPTYPSFAGYFFIDPISIDNKLDEIKQAYKNIKADVNTRENNLISMKAALSPLSKPSYTNDYDELIVPHSYEKEFKLFDMITVRFYKRDTWLHFQDLKKTVNEDPYTSQAIAWQHKVGAFTNNDDRNKFVCQSADDNLNAAKEKLMGNYEAFNNTYKKIIDNVNWYIAATTPYIRTVHDVKLNAYLNYKRETVIRGAVVLQYAGWLNACVGISNAIDESMIVARECLHKNITTLNTMGNGDVKIKKLSTWPEPCNVPTGDYGSSDYGATLSMTCNELKVSLGKGVKFNWDTKFGANEAQDVTKISISAGWDKSKSKDVNIDGYKVGEAGAKAEATADVFITMQNGHLTDAGVEATGKITVKTGVKSGNSDLDKYLPNGSIAVGGSASLTVQTGFKGTADPVTAAANNVPK